jgi:hypothetical protein
MKWFLALMEHLCHALSCDDDQVNVQIFTSISNRLKN